MNNHDQNDNEDSTYNVCKATVFHNQEKRSDRCISANNSSIEDIFDDFSCARIITAEESCVGRLPDDSNDLEIVVGKQPLKSVENNISFLQEFSTDTDQLSRPCLTNVKDETLDDCYHEPGKGTSVILELKSHHEDDSQLNIDDDASGFLKSLDVTVPFMFKEETQPNMSPTNSKSVWYGKLNEKQKYSRKLRFCDETPKAVVRRRCPRRKTIRAAPENSSHDFAPGSASQEFAKLRECRVNLLRFDDETQPDEAEPLSSSDNDENDVIVDVITKNDTKQLISDFKPSFNSTQQKLSSSDADPKCLQEMSIKTASIDCQTTPIVHKSKKLCVNLNSNATPNKESKEQAVQTLSVLDLDDKAVRGRKHRNIPHNLQSDHCKKTFNFVFSKRPRNSVTSTPKHVNSAGTAHSFNVQKENSFVPSASVQQNSKQQSRKNSAPDLGAVVLLLCIPIISSTRWQKFFKLRLLQRLAAFCQFGFWCAVVFQIVLFIDAYTTMKKYEDRSEMSVDKSNIMAIHENHLNLFRAQRNVYISGFALFLLIVIYRLQRLISSNAILSLSNEAFRRQAENASKTAEKFMADNEMLKTKLEKTQQRENAYEAEPSAPPEKIDDDEGPLVEETIGGKGKDEQDVNSNFTIRHRGKGALNEDEKEAAKPEVEGNGDKKEE